VHLRCAEDEKDEDQIFAAHWQHSAAGLIFGIFGVSELPEVEHRPHRPLSRAAFALFFI
jgi:hypothetical protein